MNVGPSAPPLTRRQHEILDFLRDYTAEQGISPTLEEIAAAFGVNKVTIFGHIGELERKGVIERAARGVSRGLRIVESDAPQAPASQPVVPILGRIAAGSPIEAVESPEELDLAQWVPEGGEVYALRVRGDSMIEDAICDGDIVLVERRSTATDGETVVAVLDDEEATLKRYYREGEGVRLQPANQAMEPILVDEVEVRGVVIGVVRQF
ncbi:MAG: transcriptional repressor LexA [Planctomycetota bacterium]|jgi:repressor LexA|nr:transcriptional repressor LexA [Planctomycetota bacterium]MDP6990060.1 transcriptional repressor LexA [Planctomycetota bacterium]